MKKNRITVGLILGLSLIVSSLALHYSNNLTSNNLTGNLSGIIKPLQLNRSLPPLKVITSEAPPAEKFCFIDDALKIGTYVPLTYIGAPNVKVVQSSNQANCKNIVIAKGYRYADYYKTSPDFAVVCTATCSITDTQFMDASFEGITKAVQALKEAVGYLPKQKLEYHLGQDGDCFKNGYVGAPPGYNDFVGGVMRIYCDEDYAYFINNKNSGIVPYTKLLDDQRSLSNHTLAIHEPIHAIFGDYSPNSLGEPYYIMQESFAVAISQIKTGFWNSYGDSEMGSKFSINNPPSQSDPANLTTHDKDDILHFFTYSLNKRFGFDMGPLTLRFFELYKNDTGTYTNPSERMRSILRKVLGKDPTASFNDIGITPSGSQTINLEFGG